MIDEHAKLVRSLIELRTGLDRELKQTLAAAGTAKEQAQGEAEAALAAMAGTEASFKRLLAHARTIGLPTDTDEQIPASFDGDAAGLFEQTVERLEQAIEHAEHTQAALAAERERQQQRSTERERERRERLAKEQRRLEQARENDRKLLLAGAAALLASVVTGAAVSAAAGLMVPGICAAVLSIAAVNTVSTISPRLGKPWSVDPTAPYAMGRLPWSLATTAAVLFGCYAVASLSSGLDLARLAPALTIVVVGAGVSALGRAKALSND
jgi:cation transport ATPase